MLHAFSFCFSVIRRYKSQFRYFSTDTKIKKNAKETLRVWQATVRRARARRTAFAVVQKEQPNAFNAYYQSSIHKRATPLRNVSQKLTLNPAKNYHTQYTSITRSATSERWARGCPARRAWEANVPILRRCYMKVKQPWTREANKANVDVNSQSLSYIARYQCFSWKNISCSADLTDHR